MESTALNESQTPQPIIEVAIKRGRGRPRKDASYAIPTFNEDDDDELAPESILTIVRPFNDDDDDEDDDVSGILDEYGF